MGFLIVFGGAAVITLLIFLYRSVGLVFIKKFIEYEIILHERGGRCNSQWCRPGSIYYRRTMLYPASVEGNSHERIRQCCIESAKERSNNWLYHLIQIRRDGTVHNAFAKVSEDRVRSKKEEERIQKILEELRQESPEELKTFDRIMKAIEEGEL